jgi:hypothetical protein
MENNKSLWELTKDYIEVEDLLENLTEMEYLDGIDEGLEDAFKRIKQDRTKKIESCLKLFHSYNARAELVAGEIKRLQQHKKKMELAAESIKNYLSRNLLVGEKFLFPCGSIGWRASEELQMLPSPDGMEPYIPEEFRRIKVELDKVEMKKAIKAGASFEGFALVQKNNIQLK